MYAVTPRPEHHPATIGRGPREPPLTPKGLVATAVVIPAVLTALAYPAVALAVVATVLLAAAAGLALRALAGGLFRRPSAAARAERRSPREGSVRPCCEPGCHA